VPLAKEPCRTRYFNGIYAPRTGNACRHTFGDIMVISPLRALLVAKNDVWREV
jgi:hypothetical protein